MIKQTAFGAQSIASPSKIEAFREFEADLSALFYTVYDNLLQDFVYMTVSIDIDDFFNIRCQILRNIEIEASIQMISSISDAGFCEILRLRHRYRGFLQYPMPDSAKY